MFLPGNSIRERYAEQPNILLDFRTPYYFGPLAALGISLAPVVLDKLLNKGGRGGGSGALDAASQAEAALLQQRQRLTAQIESLIGSMAEGGRPPAFKLDLENPQDIEKFLSGIASPAELNSLMKLLGVSGTAGTGASRTSAILGQQRDIREEDQLGQLSRDLILAFLSKPGAGGGGGGGSGGN